MQRDVFKTTLYIGLFLAIFALIAAYLDPSDNKFPAACIISIAPNLVTFYFSNLKHTETSSHAQVSFVPKAVRYRIPDSMALSILLIVLIGYMNLLLEVFQVNASQIGVSDSQYIELQIAVVGVISLGNMFPISAIGASRIGYKPVPVKMKSAFLATTLTMGSLTVLAVINAIASGRYTIEYFMHALFSPNGTTPLPTRGKWVMVGLTLGSGLLTILAVGIWLGLWAKFGAWRFRRRYTIIS